MEGDLSSQNNTGGQEVSPPTVSDWQSSSPGVASVEAKPSAASHFPADADGVKPVPVVRVLSPVGVEYVFMVISLFAAAVGLVFALLSLVNGKTDFSVLAFPTALLVVSVPVFALLFLRLKKVELNNPDQRLDASKRRSTQFIQIISFLASFFTLVGLVFSIFAKLGGQSTVSIWKACLDALVILVVFGGILFYYWRDEHRVR